MVKNFNSKMKVIDRTGFWLETRFYRKMIFCVVLLKTEQKNYFPVSYLCGLEMKTSFSVNSFF